jgi:PAT family beta-lactamase induction signal transducer AmpG
MMMNKKKLFWIYALSASVYFGQGIEGLPSLPFFFFMKENLHLDESQIMFYSSFITLPWLIKILWGYLIDSSKYSKKIWILCSLIGSLLFSFALGLMNYLPLIWIIIFMAIASGTTAVRDVGVDGIMCVEGKKHKITGKIQSLEWGFITVAGILTGFLGGFLAEHSSYQMGYLLLIPIYLIIIAIIWQYKGSTIVPKNEHLFTILKQLFTDKRLLLVCLFLFLYKFSPAFGTPLTFILKDKFHWSKLFIGTINTVSSCVSLIGAWLYFQYSKKLNLTKWLIISVFIGSVITLCYLVYTPITAIVYNIFFSFIGMFISLLILDFMAQNTKKGLESTSFALLCSISNLAATCNGFAGSFLFPIIGLQWLIVISAVTSFACLPIIPYLKRSK